MAHPEALDRPLFMEERRSIILELLADSSTVRVSELAARFDVSPATIRTDIRRLEAEGKLQRTHGGAIATEDSRYPAQMTPSARRSIHKRQKTRIAQEAAKIISDNDFLLVDSGSTTQAFVSALVGKRHLTILTNDIVIANFADERLADATCILLGGVVRAGFQNTHGTETIEMLRNYHAPYLITSSDVLSVEHGLSTYTPEQAALKRAMYAQADCRIALVDSSKFGHDAPARVADLDEVSILITDRALSEEDAERIRAVEDGPELRLA